MSVDALLSEAKKSLQTPNDSWIKSPTKTVFNNLFGATVVLSQCKELFEIYLHNGGDLKTMNWKSEPLVDDLESAIDKNNGILTWSGHDNFSPWAIGLFINKAEANVAAALDKCTTAWLGLKLGINLEKPRKDDEPLLKLSVRTQLRILQELYDDNEIKSDINSLYMGLKGTFSSEKNCRQKIKCTSCGFLEGSLDEMVANNKHLPNKAQCTGIVWGRVNSFKHHVKSALDRDGLDFLGEWLITLHAVICVSNFWKTMLQATEPIYGADKKIPST